MISSDAVIVKIYNAYYITSNSLGGNGEVCQELIHHYWNNPLSIIQLVVKVVLTTLNKGYCFISNPPNQGL